MCEIEIDLLSGQSDLNTYFFSKLNTSNMVADFDFKRFVFKYFWVPGMLGILVLNFTSCAENYDPATRLLPISVLFSGGENSAEIYRP